LRVVHPRDQGITGERMKNILVVDDNSRVRFMLSEALEKTDDGYQVVAVQNGREAITKFKESEFDLVITDYKMPLKNGVELVETIRTLDTAIPVIMITAYGSDELRSDTGHLNIFRYLDKPLKISKIRQAARDALKSAHPPPNDETANWMQKGWL
jgi:CheY-like chemotaxis protein